MATTAMCFGDLKSTENLKKLNDHLTSHSYITGHNATQDDVKVLCALASPPCQYPAIGRWAKHISHFSHEEQSNWPKGCGAVGGSANKTSKVASKNINVTAAAKKDEDDDSDFDPFAEETEEDKAAKESMAAKATAAKPKKQVINKSTLVLEVKPVSTEINLDEVEKLIRQIQIEGLEWSKVSKKLPIAYGLEKLQIGCVIFDDLVNTGTITDAIETIGLNEADALKKIALRDGEIEADEDDEEDLGLVQSAEIVSFNKL